MLGIDVSMVRFRTLGYAKALKNYDAGYKAGLLEGCSDNNRCPGKRAGASQPKGDIMTRLTVLLALLAAPVAARAESLHCDRAALVRAENNARGSQRVLRACMDPAECRVADQLVAATSAQVNAARALCGIKPPGPADPFEVEAVDTTDYAAWVLTSQVADEFAGWARP